MPFQQPGTIGFGQAAGIPGELAYNGPKRVFPWTLVSTPQLNVVGATAYTEVSEGVATAGGTGILAGILVDPKSYVNFGTAVLNGALNPSMVLPDNVIGQLAVMGIYFALLTTAANIGDRVSYNTTTGALASFGANTTFAGSSSGTTLTVTGTPSGFMGPGATLGAGFVPGTIIVANGTGTGGAGTYTLNISQTVGAGTFVANGIPPTGYTPLLTSSKVILRQSAANSTAIIQLTSE